MNAPINNLIVQNAGTNLSGIVAANGTSPVAVATAAQLSTAIDLIGSTRGSVLYRGAAGWAILAPGTAGYALVSNGAGADPSYAVVGAGTVTSVSFTGGLISVANPTTTPALTVAGTSGGIPYFSGPTTWASSGALAANALVIGGGAGVAPSTTTTGTGILTFLGTPSGANLAAALTTALPETKGGTNQTTYATGDILYASAANTLSKLAVGINTHVLTLTGGVPVWAAPAAGTGTVNSGLINQLAYYAAAGTAVSGLTTANSSILVTNGSGVPAWGTTLPAHTSGTITFVSSSVVGSDGSGSIGIISGGTNQNARVIPSGTGAAVFSTLVNGMDANVLVYCASNDYQRWEAMVSSATGADYSPIFEQSRSRGTNASPAVVTLDDRLGSNYYRGYNGAGWSLVGNTDMRASENWSGSGSSVGTYYTVSTVLTGASSRAERTRVSGAGNLLIGTTSDTGLTGSGGLKVGSTTNSTTTTTGALLVGGGIGVVNDMVIGGLIKATSSIKSIGATAGIGYGTGAGGTVTQATNKSTGVTLNKVTGQITLNNAALAAGASVSFTLTNSAIAATDTVDVSITSAATADSYNVSVTAVAAGSCRIQVQNFSAGSLSEALVINFNVFKGASS